ncbi:MAG: RNA-binding protein [Pseudomonadota bacterium]
MGRGGVRKDRDTGPERKCIATGAVQPKSGLIRFVVGPDDGIVPDLAGKLPGRGIWLSATVDAVQLAVKKKLFARAARQAVSVPDDIELRLEALVLRRVTDLISLARKAGEALAGYEQVKAALLNEEAAVLIQASDGSERGKTKLRRPGGDDTYIGCLTAHELGLSFGREHVIHAALASGGLSKRVVEDAARLSGLRGLSGANTPERT